MFKMNQIMPETQKTKTGSALALAFSLGYKIAIPISLLALLGRYGDKKFNSSPLILLIGILIALSLTTLLIYRDINRFEHQK